MKKSTAEALRSEMEQRRIGWHSDTDSWYGLEGHDHFDTQMYYTFASKAEALEWRDAK